MKILFPINKFIKNYFLLFSLQHSVCRYCWLYSNLVNILCTGSRKNTQWTFCTLRSIGRGELVTKIDLFMRWENMFGKKYENKQKILFVIVASIFRAAKKLKKFHFFFSLLFHTTHTWLPNFTIHILIFVCLFTIIIVHIIWGNLHSSPQAGHAIKY